MIKTTKILKEELEEFTNSGSKIQRLVKERKLFPIVKGIYETDSTIPGYYLAPIIYGPSYLSFEFALAYHSLIPEAVYNFTSATFKKKKAKHYKTPFGTFTYRDVPSDVYPLGITLYSENGYGFQIASPEKAICDKLYTISPVKNRNELKRLLFEDLRIDKDEFFALDMKDLFDIASCYSTQNHRLLKAYVKRRIKNESNY